MLCMGRVDGLFWEVLFRCDEVISLNIENDSDITAKDPHLVLEVNVLSKPLEKTDEKTSAYFNDSKPELVWFIDIYGHTPLSLVCGKFNWRLNELSEQQYEAKFA